MRSWNLLGYRSKNWTETALSKMINDFLTPTDAGDLVVLLLLDLQSFFFKMGSHLSKCYPWSGGSPRDLDPFLFSIYLLLLGMLCWYDHTIQSIIDCLADVRLWMLANSLDFNENKTEVIVFTASGWKDHDLDLLCLAPFEQSVVTSLGVKLHAALNLNLQINALTRSCFFQMQRLARVRSFFSKKNIDIVTHAFVMSRLNYCCSLYAGLRRALKARLQLV